MAATGFLTTAGLTRVVDKWDGTNGLFTHIMPRNVGGVDALTNRIATATSANFAKGTAANGSVVWTMTINGSDCTSLPMVIHDIQLYIVSTAGTVMGTIVADVDKTLSSAGDKIVQTFTISEANGAA